MKVYCCFFVLLQSLFKAQGVSGANAIQVAEHEVDRRYIYLSAA